ncbi:MAG TPA: polysaccharide biosynthesis tyrosine autokinase [Cytophagaceae bacterium]|jgi:capsular exopolysaccharide synthesis family protein
MDLNDSNHDPHNSGNYTPTNLAQDFDLAKFILVLLSSVKWVLLLLFTCFLFAWIYIRYTKPVYESSSVIKLDIQSHSNVLGLSNPEIPDGNGANLSGEIEILKSRLIYEKMVDQPNLKVSYFAEGKVISEERYKSSNFKVLYKIKDIRFYDFPFVVKIVDEDNFQFKCSAGERDVFESHRFGETINHEGFELKIYKNPLFTLTSNKDYSFIINSDEHLIKYLMDNVSIEILNSGASTIKISFQDHNKFKAKDIVNSIDSLYLIQTLQNKNKAQEQTLKFLDATLDSTELSLTRSELKLEGFVKQNKTIDVKNDFGKLGQEIDDLEKERLRIKMRIGLLNDLKELLVTRQDIRSFTPSIAELPDPQLITLITNLNLMEQERDQLLASQKENTFVIKSKDLAISNIKSNVLEVITQNKKLLYDQLRNYTEKSAMLDKAFLGLPSKETEYTRLKRFYALYEKYYLLLMEKKAEYGIAKAGTVPHFVVLSPASIPFAPVFPNPHLIYLLSLGIFLLFSLIFILVKYFLHNTISTQKEIEQAVSAPVLGGIPEYRKTKHKVSKLLVDKEPRSALSEALRSIRTNLEFLAPGSKKKILAVSSTVSGEGKTFVTVNLAAIIALSGKKVIVLDLDMRKPKVHLAFESDNGKGISTYLSNQDPLEVLIQRTSIDTLHFIPAGPIPPNPSELILQDKFDAMLNELSLKYDTILIDTPPVGLVTDGILILKKADIPIYVVRANYSKVGVKRNINKLIHANGFSKLSIIVNALTAINNYTYGGYDYAINYNNAYHSTGRQNKEKKTGKDFKSLFTFNK